jgi:hypothetical protein
LQLNFSKDDFEILSQGDILFKLAAKSKIDEIYEGIKEK